MYSNTIAIANGMGARAFLVKEKVAFENPGRSIDMDTNG